MANNCYNYVVATGDREQLKALSDKLKAHILNDNVYNHATGMLDLWKLTNCKDNEDIYAKAGTKWWDVDIETNEDEVIISGDSAWSPALELIQHLSIEFNKLHFEFDYEEAGCDFGGWAEIQNRDLEDNSFTYWEYKFKRDYALAYEQARDEIKYFLDDNQADELENHDIKKYMKKKDFDEIVEEFQQELKDKELGLES